MEHSKQPFLKRLLSVRGMGAALTAFAGLIIIYIAFGLINPTVFSGRNIEKKMTYKNIKKKNNRIYIYT